MNILVINAGSSSLKYQLLNPETQQVLAKGLCERIGIDGKFTYKPQMEGKQVLDAIDIAMPTHSEAIQAVLDALVDKDNGVIGFMKEIDAVGHRVDLLHGADHAVLGIHQGVQNGLDGLGVGGHGHVGVLDGLLAGGLIGELAVQANALTQALGQDLLSVGVEQLILQRGAAGVDDKNVHGNRSPFQCSRSSEAFSHLRAVWALCSPDGSGNAGQRRDVQFGKARLAFGAGLVVH